jgi:hypothetical protein
MKQDIYTVTYPTPNLTDFRYRDITDEIGKSKNTFDFSKADNFRLREIG